VTVIRDGQPFDHAPSLRHFNHSPDGFEWGYGGSGPAQLALAILLDFCEPAEAIHWHQPFKWHVIAALPKQSWVLGATAVEQWLELARKNFVDLELVRIGQPPAGPLEGSHDA
jgi:hypothetical protein